MIGTSDLKRATGKEFSSKGFSVNDARKPQLNQI